MVEALLTRTVEPIRRAFAAEKAKAWHYKIHPYYTKQPSNVVGEYIRHFCPQRGLVVDPFCGSGVTAIEALASRRRAVCLDLDPLAVFITQRPMRWELDRERSSSQHKEGHVVLEGGLKEGEPSVSYRLTCELSPGSVCMTKDEIARKYGSDPLPYETVERQIIFPTRRLLLQVRFFEGYKAAAQPAIFHGKERVLNPVRPKRDSFEFDEKSNSAIFCVSCPRIFHNYVVYWEPLD